MCLVYVLLACDTVCFSIEYSFQSKVDNVGVVLSWKHINTFPVYC